jgi:inner membrane protein
MATVMTHAFVGAAMVFGWRKYLRPETLRAAAFYAAIVAMIPDLDVVLMMFGVEYSAPFGHRGFSHSLVFALMMAVVGTPALRLRCGIPVRESKSSYAIAFLLLFLATASHPLLDMLTDGGYGCALFAPFSWERLFFPVTPIPVSPIGLHYGVLEVFLWEIALVWPVFCGLTLHGLSTSRVLRLSALVAGAAGGVIAVWARQQIVPFY